MFKMLFGLFFMLLPIGGILSTFREALFYPGMGYEWIFDILKEHWIIFAMCFVFIIIGFKQFIKGAKEVFANSTTANIGIETYGYVCDYYPSNEYVNNNALYIAQILTLNPDGKFEMYNESIGFYNNAEKHINQYVRLKQHKKDVNILDVVNSSEVPQILKEYVDEKFLGMKTEEKEINTKNDYVIIDGVKYIRKDK